MDDDNHLLTKIKRVSGVGLSVGGLAARVIGEKVFNKNIDDAAYSVALKNTLGNMKGPFMKIAQFLATIPGALPDEYTEQFLTLQNNAPPMGSLFVKRRMQAELGNDWRKHFASFDETPFAAASLGQVHRATDIEGKPLAIKLQYPNMRAIVDADLAQLSVLIKTYHMFNKALRLDGVLAEMRDRLDEELNYIREAENIANFHCWFYENPDVIVPDVNNRMSTERMLVMEYIEGENLLEIIPSLTQLEREHIAKTLFKTWYHPFYMEGWLHSDPHPGNYKIINRTQLGLLDFGCVRYFQNSFVDGVIDLYHALKHNDRELIVEAFNKWGFTDLSDPLIDIMSQWAQLLYAPLLDNRKRPIQEGFNAKNGWQTAVDVHRQLHDLGGIYIPQEFVFMDRASVGIGGVLMRLGVELNWHELFEEILEERAALKSRMRALNEKEKKG